MFTALIKGLSILWPFIKEAVLKNRSLRKAVTENKVPSALFFLLLVMFGTILFNADNTAKQSDDFQKLQHDYNILKVRYEEQKQLAEYRQQLLVEAADRRTALLARFDAKEKQLADLTALVNRLKDLEYRPPPAAKGAKPYSQLPPVSSEKEAILKKLREYKDSNMKPNNGAR